MTEYINPYITGDSLGENNLAFIGRKDIFRAISGILTDGQKNSIVLYGQRRIGKTSILRHIKKSFPQKGVYIPVYIDFQKKVGLPLDKLVQRLAEKIAFTLGEETPNLGSIPEKTFEEDWLPGYPL